MADEDVLAEEASTRALLALRTGARAVRAVMRGRCAAVGMGERMGERIDVGWGGGVEEASTRTLLAKGCTLAHVHRTAATSRAILVMVMMAMGAAACAAGHGAGKAGEHAAPEAARNAIEVYGLRKKFGGSKGCCGRSLVCCGACDGCSCRATKSVQACACVHVLAACMCVALCACVGSSRTCVPTAAAGAVHQHAARGGAAHHHALPPVPPRAASGRSRALGSPSPTTSCSACWGPTGQVGPRAAACPSQGASRLAQQAGAHCLCTGLPGASMRPAISTRTGAPPTRPHRQDHHHQLPHWRAAPHARRRARVWPEHHVLGRHQQDQVRCHSAWL